MISKNQIRQHIKNLYRQNLNADALEYEVFRLKKMGPEVVYTLVELFDSEDIDFREFIITLIEELEDRDTFPILSELAYYSNKPDEMKVLATTIIAYLGGVVDYHRLRENLKAPEELDEIIIRNMLRNLGNPYYLEQFLELFPEFEYENKLTMVEYLTSIDGNERLADIAGALFGMCASSELRALLIEALRNSKSSRAYPYLKEIIQKSADRKLQALARKAIFQLGELDSKGELLRIEPQAIFHEAYITSHDGNGDQILAFSTIEKRRIIKVLCFIFSNKMGIKEAFGNQFNKKEYREYIKDFKSNNSFLITKISPSYFFEKTKQAEQLTASKSYNLPREYLAWRTIFNCKYDDEYQWEEKNFEYQKLLQNVKSKEKKLLPRTPKLYEEKAISSSWYFNFDQLEPELIELIQLEEQFQRDNPNYPEKYAKIFNKAFKKVITDEFINLLSGMLSEYAFLCFLEAKSSQAELALVAANSLLSSNKRDEHPFIRQMIEYSFDVHLNGIFTEADADIPQLELFQQEILNRTEISNLTPDNRVIAKVNLKPANSQMYDELDDSDFLEADPLLLPQNSGMTYFDKLQYLSEVLPETSFSQNFPKRFASLSNSEKICLLNEWETEHDSFISILVGEIDWYKLRSELGIHIPERIIKGPLEEIETSFLGQMPERGYDWEHLRLARRLWKEFVYIKDAQISPMRKPEAWAAAIEYLVGALYYDRDPKIEVAESYGVSVASLSARYKTLKEALNLKIYSSEFDKSFSHISDLITLMYNRDKEDS